MSAAIVMFHGSLDASTKKATSAVLQSVNASSQITLDLTDVDGIDSSFFAALVSVYRGRLAERNPAALRVIGNERVLKLFHIVGLDRCVEIYAEGDKRAADIRLVELLGAQKTHPVQNAEVLTLR